MSSLIRLICFLFPFFSSAIVPIIIPRTPTINPCRDSYCGENYGTKVFNPFRLVGQQPERCGSRGYDLRCGNDSTMLINLPKSSMFGVRGIDYDYETIQIYDTLNCLPASLLTLDLSGTPFSNTNMQNLTLITCQKDESLSRSNFTTITVGCLGNSTFSTLATTTSTNMVRSLLIGGNHTSCEISGVLKVPTQEQRHDHKVISSSWNPDNDIYLKWSRASENSFRVTLLIIVYCAWLLVA